MAVLAAPTIDFSGANEPKSQGALVLSQDIASPDVVVFGPHALVLAAPAANQLVPPPPTPDAGLFVWQRSIVNSSGDVITDARIDVRRAEDNVVADLFTDRDGTAQKSNPFFVDDEGFAIFYAAAGLYTIRAFNASLERIFENVLLGVRLADLPDLTSLVTPILEDLLAPVLDEVETQLEGVSQLVRFSVDDDGDSLGAPGSWVTARTGVGEYSVTHNNGSTNYHPKLQIWDPSVDRVFSAMMVTKTANAFTYRVRSIHDEASSTDARVDIEVTFPGG